MDRKLIAAVTFAVGAALSTTAFAQGRHDDRPHGVPKPAEATAPATGNVVGGRHDERPHGMKKTKKTDAAKKAGDTRKDDVSTDRK